MPFAPSSDALVITTTTTTTTTTLLAWEGALADGRGPEVRPTELLTPSQRSHLGDRRMKVVSPAWSP